MEEIHNTIQPLRPIGIDKIKGKLCHFVKHDFARHGLIDYYWKPIDEINFDELKDKVVKILKGEGFVFFDKINYEIKTKFSRLTEFSVNFWHIK